MEWINPVSVISIIMTGLAAMSTVLIMVGKWIGKREEFEKTAKGNFADINRALAEIQTDVKKLYEKLQVPISSSDSPRRLTDFGQSISATLEAQAWAERTAKTLYHGVESLTPYAIQEYSFKFVAQGEGFPTEDIAPENGGCGVHPRGVYEGHT